MTMYRLKMVSHQVGQVMKAMAEELDLSASYQKIRRAKDWSRRSEGHFLSHPREWATPVAPVRPIV